MKYQQHTDYELLELLLGNTTALTLQEKKLSEVFYPREGRAHPTLEVAQELVRRAIHERICDGYIFSCPEGVTDYLCMFFAGQNYESFVTLFLDTKHRLIASEEMFRGTLDETRVYPREVARRALELHAGAVIFAHNHPSGDPEPSMGDITLTKRLKETLALIEVRVLDHLVVGKGDVVSFASTGRI